MTLRKRSVLKLDNFDFGVSYKIDEKRLSFFDAKNIHVTDQGIEKRFGLIPENGQDSPTTPINSLSFYNNSKNVKSKLGLAGSTLFKYDGSQIGDNLLTDVRIDHNDNNLQFSQRIRTAEWNNRQIIALGEKGLYQYDGEIFSKCGSLPPNTPTVSLVTNTTYLTSGSYQVALTFYSSKTGYESNACSPTGVQVVSGHTINLSGIDSECSNKFVDKIRVYLRNVNNVDYYFYDEISLGVTTLVINRNTNSSQVPPTDSYYQPNGGAKYLTVYGNRLAIAGNYPDSSDVILSNEDDPESFNDRLYIKGHGPITGIATGLFNDTVLDPYLVIFKEDSTYIYSGIGDQARLVQLNSRIGCSSHDSIIVRNGHVYFLSKYGFYGIANGRMIKKDDHPYPLGGDSLDSIFKEKGFIYQSNRSYLKYAFSFYMQSIDSYVTFLAESGSNEIKKAYVYNFKRDAFYPWSFPVGFSHGVLTNYNNEEELLLNQYNYNNITDPLNIYPQTIFKLRKDNEYQDYYYDPDTEFSTSQYLNNEIDCYAILNWYDGNDYDCSYNFRELITRVNKEQPTITVKTWANFTLNDQYEQFLDVNNPDAVFILDQSSLDVDSLGDGRGQITSRIDLNQSAESILIGFFQSEANSNMIICSMQLNFSKNGNRNI